jgi:hypothetical protein
MSHLGIDRPLMNVPASRMFLRCLSRVTRKNEAGVLNDPGNVLISHSGPACDVDRMFYPHI